MVVEIQYYCQGGYLIFLRSSGESCASRRSLLSGHGTPICGLSLSGCLLGSLDNHVGLMDGGLDDLLFFRIKVLSEVLVKSGLFLLKTCVLLANWVNVMKPRDVRNRACLNMLYGSTLSRGVSRRLSSSSSSSSSSLTAVNFCAWFRLV